MVAGHGFLAEGGQGRDTPLFPPRPRPLPAQGHAPRSQLRRLGACSQRPLGTNIVLKAKKESKIIPKRKRGLGQTPRGCRRITRSPFAIDKIAKCVNQTAQPGQERERAGKVGIGMRHWVNLEGIAHVLACVDPETAEAV